MPQSVEENDQTEFCKKEPSQKDFPSNFGESQNFFPSTYMSSISNAYNPSVTNQTNPIDNRVILRIWPPSIDKRMAAAFNVTRLACNAGTTMCVGHVSLETSQYYASFWPKDGTVGDFQLVKPSCHILEEDIAAEDDKKPDITVCLYTLNSELISAAFSEIKRTYKGYILGGDSSLVSEKSHSCSSLAYCLLKVGGFEALPRPRFSPKSAAVTPDQLKKWAISAKKREYVNVNWTQSIKLEDEYIPQEKSIKLRLGFGMGSNA